MTTPLPDEPAAGRALVPVLHLVTTDDVVMRADFLTTARALMQRGGPRLALHLRAPRLDARTVHDLAVLLADAQESTAAWLVVHERVDVAVASGARGVQLTQASLGVGQARAIAPNIAIGASAHTLDDVRAAARAAATWIVLDGVRVVRDDAEHPADAGPSLLARAARVTRIPIIALGGVLPQDVAALRAAGAHGVAAIRGVWDALNAVTAAGEYLSAHDAGGATRVA